MPAPIIVANPVFAWAARGFAYIPITKCACTSIKWALREARGLSLPARWEGIHGCEWPELRTLEWAAAHSGGVCGRPTEQELADPRGHKLLVWAVVRNPWDRLWSAYKYFVDPDRLGELRVHHPRFRLGMSFDEFAGVVCEIPNARANEHIRSQVPQLSFGGKLLGKGHGFCADFTKFENLAAEWPAFRWLPPLRRFNATERRPAPWTKRLLYIVGDRYADDVKAFDYSGPLDSA